VPSMMRLEKVRLEEEGGGYGGRNTLQPSN
jgi:hypothetical protein